MSKKKKKALKRAKHYFFKTLVIDAVIVIVFVLICLVLNFAGCLPDSSWRNGFGTANEDDYDKVSKRTQKPKIDKNDPLLVLVNKDNKLPDDYQKKLKALKNGENYVNEVIYEDLVEMMNDASREGYDFWIASGYRSAEQQQALVFDEIMGYLNEGYSVNQAREKTYDYMLPSGYSEHETGLALDILCSTNMNMDDSQEYEPGNKWLRKHCAEYGFIFRYPKDKEDITGINYEPWHFRYVGKDVAEYIMDNDLCLEEVLE